MRYDHFHCEYRDKDGNKGEIEGGWTSLNSETLDGYKGADRHVYLVKIAESWGMPEGAEITNFRVAG